MLRSHKLSKRLANPIFRGHFAIYAHKSADDDMQGSIPRNYRCSLNLYQQLYTILQRNCPDAAAMKTTSQATKTTETNSTNHNCKQNINRAVLFDMDGVLVDVTNSYRKAIQQTVQFFTGTEATLLEIQQFKEQGGYNNDWDLTEAILKKQGKHVAKPEIITQFQKVYLGSGNTAGLIENEQWLLPKTQLAKLHGRFRLGIVTGRPRQETRYVLHKFGVEECFDVVVAMEDYPPEKAKPCAFPIELALQKLGEKAAVYVGDSVDDMAAAVNAGVQAVGCIPLGVTGEGLKEKLLKCGAVKVLGSITEISSYLL